MTEACLSRIGEVGLSDGHQNVDVTIPEAILVALRLGDEADPRRAPTHAALDSLKAGI